MPSLKIAPSLLSCDFANIERDPLWPGLVANRPQPKDGMIAVPQGPGFGLELDADMIARYRVD